MPRRLPRRLGREHSQSMITTQCRRFGNNGRVALHADFWVVAGTASPVIALAAVITHRDATAEARRLADEVNAVKHRKPGDDLWPEGSARFWMMLAVIASMYNIFAQMFVLLAALDSLSTGKDVPGRGVIVFIEFFGIGVLAVAGTASFQFRRPKQTTTEQPEPEESAT
jgi:hypothetical protein